MKLTNDREHFGIVSIVLHWSIALLTIALFFLGLWLVELDYYDPWFQLAPWWHKGLGVLTLLLVIVRIVWKGFSIKSLLNTSIPDWQKTLATLIHGFLDMLLIVICLTGYFIVTARGDSLPVFDLFEIPAILDTVKNMEEFAGEAHYLLAYLMMVIVSVHILAALKHHFINRDNILRRMLGR